jgi:streptomycin 6-kinase
VTPWGLELGEPYPASYHEVRRARLADGTAVVIKTGPDLDREAAALRAWDGHGAVRLLLQAPGALLLEQVHPGTPAAALVPDADEQATAAAVEVLRRLHVAQPPDDLPTLPTTLRALSADVPDRLAPRDLVDHAAGLARELLAGAVGPVLLHGDLHHDNVLRHGDGWVAIDPHGAVGDPGYDTGAWLYNPVGVDGVLGLVPRRVEQLADGLGLAVERVAAWGFVKAVLSAVWTAQDSGRPPPADDTLAVAALLRP